MEQLAIIIINWNNAGLTTTCVASIQQWNCSKRILVVDNHSNNDDINLLKESIGEAQIIFLKENKGFAEANNIAITHLIEEGFNGNVLLLNNDAGINESDLLSLLKNFNSKSQIAAIGPIIEEKRKQETVFLHGGRNITHFVNTRIDKKEKKLKNELVACDYVPGMVFLFNSSVYNKVGPFDEAYFFSGEIADWCQRAKSMGYASYIDNSISAWHDKSKGALEQNELYNYYSLRNRFLFNKKHKQGKALKWITQSIFWSLSRLVRFDFKGFRSIALAMFHGIRGKFGNQNAKF